MHNAIKKVVFAGAVALSCTTLANAWGDRGHRLVAMVAENRLTPAARINVQLILGKDSLASIAAYADEYRHEHGDTAEWHYVDIPKDATSYDRDRDCPANHNHPGEPADSPWRDCAADRIPYFIAQLRKPGLSLEDKRLALEMLVHLVGDLHQPLHAIGDARGGNDIKIAFLGTQQCGERTRCNLHGVWDYGMIDRRGLNDKKYLAALEAEISEHHWDQVSQENPKVWAEQSHQMAVSAWVPNNVSVGRDYYEAGIKVIDRQMAVAGIRLARILNSIFTVAPPAATSTQTEVQPAK